MFEQLKQKLPKLKKRKGQFQDLQQAMIGAGVLVMLAVAFLLMFDGLKNSNSTSATVNTTIGYGEDVATTVTEQLPTVAIVIVSMIIVVIVIAYTKFKK